MGVENNECVIATTWNEEDLDKVVEFVVDLDPEMKKLYTFTPSIVNVKTTVFFAPCGSKKGWSPDKLAQQTRDELIELIDSLSFDWVEVGYGEFGQKVLRGNSVNWYGDEDYAT